MAKSKIATPVPPIETVEVIKPKIQPLTHEFANGELNMLRDKVNEIIG